LRIKKYKSLLTLTALLFAFLFLVIPPGKAAVQFSDIQGHWAKAAIQKMADQAVVKGYPDGTFKPDDNISRAEFATVLVQAFKMEKKDGKVFNDTSSHWAKDYISTASAHGVISGYNDQKFGPDNFITREEMALMTVKAADQKIAASAFDCSDSSKVSAWAKDAVATAYANKLIVGMPDGSFLPQANATRAQAIMVLSKAMQLEAEAIEVPVPEAPAVPQETSSNSGTGGGGGGSGTVTIRSIEILTEPDKVNYTEGESLDLTGLAVILNKSNGTTEDVSLANFASKGITTMPADGTVLTTSNTAVTITVKNKNVSQPITVNTRSEVTVTNVSCETRAANVNWYRFTINGSYSELQIQTTAGTPLGPVTSRVDFETAGYYQGMASPDDIIVIYVDGIERYRGIPADYAPTIVTVTNVSSESRAANVNWYRFTVNGTYNELLIKTADGTPLGAVTSRAAFETAGYYQGMASPDDIIVIYVDDIERYRGIPADYASTIVTVTNVSSETRAANVNWYRFIVNGTYSELQIKTADGIPLGPVTSRVGFETAGHYQGMASPDDIIVIYVDGIERYRGIPEVYSPGGAVITGIVIKTAPVKVTYIEGDTLDLTGLVVTLSKSDGTDEDTAFADFAAKGITTSPVNGAILTTADSAVIITVNGKTASLAISVEPETPAEVTVTDVSVDKYWNGYVWNNNLYRFTVNGTYSTVQIKTEDGTAMGPKISKTVFETLGYYLAIYWEGTASPDSIIVIYVDGVEKYRGTPAVYVND